MRLVRNLLLMFPRRQYLWISAWHPHLQPSSWHSLPQSLPRRLHLWPRCLTSWNRLCQSSTLTMKGLLRNSPKWRRKRSQPWKTNTLNTSRSQHQLFWRITFHGWIQGLHLMRRSTSSWWRDRKKCVMPPGRFSGDGNECAKGLNFELPTRRDCNRSCGNTVNDYLKNSQWESAPWVRSTSSKFNPIWGKSRITGECSLMKIWRIWKLNPATAREGENGWQWWRRQLGNWTTEVMITTAWTQPERAKFFDLVFRVRVTACQFTDINRTTCTFCAEIDRLDWVFLTRSRPPHSRP